SLILHLGNLFLIVQLHFSKLFLILKSGVNHTSRGSISTSTLPSIKLRKCSSKIITSILSFISGRLATKSNQIKMPPNLGGFFMVRSYYPSECHADYFDFERIEALKPAIEACGISTLSQSPMLG